MFLLRTGRRVRRGSIANGGQQIGGDRNKTEVSGNSRFPQFTGIAASKFPPLLFLVENSISLTFPISGNAISNILSRSQERKFPAWNKDGKC